MTTGTAVLHRNTGIRHPGEPGASAVATGDGGSRQWPVLAPLSWPVPLGLDLVRLDAVLIPVPVLSVGSLLRVGGTLLDRLVVAAFVVCGAVTALGLLFSVWP